MASAWERLEALKPARQRLDATPVKTRRVTSLDVKLTSDIAKAVAETLAAEAACYRCGGKLNKRGICQDHECGR